MADSDDRQIVQNDQVQKSVSCKKSLWDKHEKFIIGHLREAEEIALRLYDLGLIDLSEMVAVKSKLSKFEINREFYQLVKDEETFRVVCSFLEETRQNLLIERLQEKMLEQDQEPKKRACDRRPVTEEQVSLITNLRF